MTKTIKIASRTSGLALAQTKEVAKRLKQVDPTLNIEIVGVKNVTGDLNKTTPLQQMGTIGVFTKEIDHLVLEGDVDIAVHSLKDIGTQRPGTLRTIAIPERAQPHDCVLFNPNILDKIKNDEEIIIGASSPRRIELVPPFLQEALPQIGTKTPNVKVVPLRGNVPNRIKKLRGEVENDIALDGVALAYAGISRLYKDDDTHDLMKEILEGLKWMVLPLSECPGAPGQGALAIEALEEREDLTSLLLKINNRQAQKDIILERNILIQHGGGCHQSFGVTAQKIGFGTERLLTIKGLDKQGNDVSETRWITQQDVAPIQNLWNGTKWRSDLFQTDMIEHPQINGEAVFVSHARAINEEAAKDLNQVKHIWTSGVPSWKKLAAQGLWVEGCADSLGYDLLIRTFLQDPVLQLPACPAWEDMKSCKTDDCTSANEKTCPKWNILTHETAKHTKTQKQVVATYKLEPQEAENVIKELKKADHIYWSSYSQYEALKEHAPEEATHICGPGRTADLLKQENLKRLIIAPNINEVEKLMKA